MFRPSHTQHLRCSTLSASNGERAGVRCRFVARGRCGGSDPISIRFLRAQRHLFETQDLAELVEKAQLWIGDEPSHRPARRWAVKAHTHARPNPFLAEGDRTSLNLHQMPLARPIRNGLDPTHVWPNSCWAAPDH